MSTDRSRPRTKVAPSSNGQGRGDQDPDAIVASVPQAAISRKLVRYEREPDSRCLRNFMIGDRPTSATATLLVDSLALDAKNHDSVEGAYGLQGFVECARPEASVFIAICLARDKERARTPNDCLQLAKRLVRGLEIAASPIKEPIRTFGKSEREAVRSWRHPQYSNG
jgi:hypothetical protein